MSNLTQAPFEEPTGYEARPGYVKSQPGNNAFYIEGYKDTELYIILKQTNEALEELIPGYNIAQIKLKFNDLRYYIDYPEVIPVNKDWPAYDTEEKIKAMVNSRITYAEGYVAGLQAAKKIT